MKRQSLWPKEVLLLALPVLALISMGVFVSKRQGVKGSAQTPSQPLLALEGIRVVKSKPFPTTSVQVLAAVQYTEPALYKRSISNLPNFNYTPLAVIDSTGQSQLFKVSIHIAYGWTEEEQAILQRANSHRPTRKGALRYLIGYDIDLSRIPKAVGSLTLKSKLSADGYSVPVIVKIRP